MRLSKTKKIILLVTALGILTTSIVTPIVISNIDKDKISKEDSDKKDVQEVIKILEQKSTSQRQIKLASDVDGKIIAKNKQKIIAKIKDLIGKSNLKGVSIEVSIKEDKDISINFEKIIVKFSKGNYSQELSEDKTILVRRSRKAVELATIDVKEVATSLKALRVKTVEVYIKDANALKITDNKNEILKAIRKLEGYKDIDLKEVNFDIKNSNDLLPTNDQNPIAITLVLSKLKISIELTTFKVKQMSLQEMANIDIIFAKNALNSLKTKIVEINSFDSIDQKITTNKAKILAEIKKIQGYSNIDFNGVNVEVKDSETLLPRNDQTPTLVTLVLSKVNASPNNVELTTFSAKQQFDVIANIENKIIDKDILIAPNVATSNRDESLIAIRNQLQKENPKLTNEDLAKISLDNEVWSLKLRKRKEATLTIAFNNRRKSINVYVAKGNSYLFINSNINDGWTGTIFQDDFGNLWSMGNNSKIQVLKANKNEDGYVNEGWTSGNSGLTKGLNINDAYDARIFQDSFGNLWIMGLYSKLKVLKVNSEKDGYVKDGWIDNNDSTSGDNLLKNSNITEGSAGKIFQDSFGNLWVMGQGKKLQVLKVNEDEDGYVETGWTSGNVGLTKNSNINSGTFGTIFQDSFKNLWAMGYGTRLQVLKVNEDEDGYVNEGWTSGNSGLTKKSNITDGFVGTIFQDSFKNLWAMGEGTKLQVLKANSKKDGYVAVGWRSVSNTNCSKGTIFQDEFGNLWIMWLNSRLLVLKVNSKKDGYTNFSSGLTKNSNITNGQNGWIFQDSFGNLWTLGFYKKLQVLKVNSKKDGYVKDGWTSGNSGLTKNSNITNGYAGKIFQDSFGNLWAMGKGSKLQVLKKDPTSKKYINSWENF